jgi:hypothetical protein
VTVLEPNNNQANAQPVAPAPPSLPSVTLPWPQATAPQPDPYQQGVRDYYSGLCYRARPYLDGPADTAALWDKGFHDAERIDKGKTDRSYCFPGRSAALEPANTEPAPSYNSQFQTAAIKLITNLLTRTDNNAEAHRSYYYSGIIKYYGSYISRDDVLAKIQDYINHWPRRTYNITSINANCRPEVHAAPLTICTVPVTLDFQAEATNRRSVGTASFEYVLEGENASDLVISVENGKVLTRQITDLKGDANKAMAECRRLHPPSERAGMALAQCLNDVRGAYGLPIECLHRC